ncbi:MAG: Crp/Fnr family transcriptional regulator [Puia sp.]|nr:Crp/Fnr family transcriptional regulator [Puia sp.]
MRGKKRSPYKLALDDLYVRLCGFVHLTKTEFGQLLRYMEIREFDKKVRVLERGETEKHINLVAAGLVRKYLEVRKQEIIFQLAEEGHPIYSEISFHSRTPSELTIETIEPTTLISISYDSLEEVFMKFPKAERLGRLLVSDLFVRKDMNYFNQLEKTTRQRFLEYVRSHPQLLQRVPQKYIASYLNIKPETFSRLKHLLKGKK